MNWLLMQSDGRRAIVESIRKHHKYKNQPIKVKIQSRNRRLNHSCEGCLGLPPVGLQNPCLDDNESKSTARPSSPCRWLAWPRSRRRRALWSANCRGPTALRPGSRRDGRRSPVARSTPAPTVSASTGTAAAVLPSHSNNFRVRQQLGETENGRHTSQIDSW